MKGTSGGRGCHQGGAGAPLCFPGTGTSPRTHALLSQWERTLARGQVAQEPKKKRRTQQSPRSWCVWTPLLLCMLHSGNRAGGDDRRCEFEPPADWRHVHRRGRSRLPAAHLHSGGRHAPTAHSQVKQLYLRDQRPATKPKDNFVKETFELLLLV